MSMRIVHLTSVHSALDVRIFHKEAKTLARAGHDVTLIAPHDRDEWVGGVRIVALPRPLNRLDRLFHLVWLLFRRALQQKARVYHLHDPELLGVGLLLKVAGRQVIFDAHENLPKQILSKQWIAPILRRPLAVVVGLIEKAFVLSYDRVVVATEDIAKRFRGKHPIVIHNYPILEMMHPRNVAHATDDECVLVYVGVISRTRGAVEMVRALQRLPHRMRVRLDLIGRFEPGDLEDELKALEGYERVRFLGWHSMPQVYRQIADADIGLLCLHPEPNHITALPTKLFEYMAAAIPVIASNFPLWIEIIERNQCGKVVDPLDPADEADAIASLMENPELGREMGKNGRRAVLEKYNWGREAENLLQVYRDLPEDM